MRKAFQIGSIRSNGENFKIYVLDVTSKSNPVASWRVDREIVPIGRQGLYRAIGQIQNAKATRIDITPNPIDNALTIGDQLGNPALGSPSVSAWDPSRRHSPS